MTNFSIIWIDEAKCPFCNERFPTRPLEKVEYSCPMCRAKAVYSFCRARKKTCTIGNRDCITEIMGEVSLTWTRK